MPTPPTGATRAKLGRIPAYRVKGLRPHESAILAVDPAAQTAQPSVLLWDMKRMHTHVLHFFTIEKEPKKHLGVTVHSKFRTAEWRSIT